MIYRFLNLLKQDYPNETKEIFKKIPKDRKQDIYDNIIDILVMNPNNSYEIYNLLIESNKKDELTYSIVISLLEKQDLLLNLLHFSVKKEVEETESLGTLFRSNNFSSKLMKFYSQRIGHSYLKKMLGPIIDTICNNPTKFEINPDKVPKNENLETNIANVYKIVDEFLTYFISSIEDTLVEYRRYCGYIYEEVEKKFKSDSSPLAPKHLGVGGFLFLRLICPCLMDPVKHKMFQGKVTPDAQRFLLIVSKILQNLSNGTTDSVKEKYMSPFFNLIKKWIPTLREFYDKISNGPYYNFQSTIKSNHEVTLGEIYNAKSIVYGNLFQNFNSLKDSIPEKEYLLLGKFMNQVEQVGAKPILFPPIFVTKFETENFIEYFASTLHMYLSRTYLQMIENLYEKLEKPIIRYLFLFEKEIQSNSSMLKKSMNIELEVVEILDSYLSTFQKNNMDPQVINHFFETIAIMIDDFIFNRFIKQKNIQMYGAVEIKMAMSSIETWFEMNNIRSFRENDSLHLKKLFSHSRQCMNLIFIPAEQVIKDLTICQDICPLLKEEHIAVLLNESLKSFKGKLNKFTGDINTLLLHSVVDFSKYSDLNGKFIQKPLFDLNLNLQRITTLDKIKIPKRFDKKEFEFLLTRFYIKLRKLK